MPFQYKGHLPMLRSVRGVRLDNGPERKRNIKNSDITFFIIAQEKG